MFKKLEKAIECRKKSLSYLKLSRSILCNIKFNDYMIKSGVNATLRFDHIETKLDILVKSKSASGEWSLNSNLKLLSGGERSFVQCALLIALWSVIDTPLLFLDEFDVFMDKENRKKSLQQIVKVAENNSTSQYVFLTPHEMLVYLDHFKMFLFFCYTKFKLMYI